jgi:hypothetical protein
MIKKKVFLFFCLFAMQVISCSSFGTIDVYPESTKLSIHNGSRVLLQNVKWNGVNFGNIGRGEVSEMEVLEGNNGKVFFTIGNKEYQTYNTITCVKHKRNSFRFIDATFIDDNGIRILLGDINEN